MNTKLSPKMSALLADMTAGTRRLFLIHGKFLAFTVFPDGTTINGKRVDPTARGLVERELIAEGVDGEYFVK